MIDRDLISAMKAAGVTDAQIVEIMSSYSECKNDRRRENDRRRQIECRARKRDSEIINQVTPVTVTHVTSVTGVTGVPSRADSITPRAHAVIPVGSSNEDPQLVNPPLPSGEAPKGAARSRSAGKTLPDDWTPGEDLFAYGAEQGLSREQTASTLEDMRIWAQANRNRAIARKADWTATAQGFIRRDAAKARQRAGPAAPSRKGGFGHMLYDIMAGEIESKSNANKEALPAETLQLFPIARRYG